MNPKCIQTANEAAGRQLGAAEIAGIRN